MRILIVEDDPALRISLRKSLEMDGHEPEEAACAREALVITTERPFHLVVSDYNLGPGMNGLSLLSHLKEQGYGVPAILMSGTREAWMVDAARDLGVSAFLEKPFPIDVFLEECLRALEGRPTTQNQQGRMHRCENKSFGQCS
jgi:DNA-binding NtrC family response regulator